MNNENNVLNEKSTSVKSKIEEAVRMARQRLLDLTLNNRLLNYRPSRRRTIQVVDEIPREIFDILVLQPKTMQFKPSEISEEEIRSLFKEEELDEYSPFLNLQNAELPKHHTDRLLQTDLTKEELYKKLSYVHRQAETVFREQGYSILYLALGFLEWTEIEHANQLNRAPLILIPVELKQQKVRTRFSLCWSGAELFPNISLEAKLKEQGVELPDLKILKMLEEKTVVDAYFQSVTEAISHQKNWRVVPDIYLDFFSFTKFVMYRDLNPAGWVIGDHPLLGEILGESPQAHKVDEFKPEEVDQVPSRNFYHVMDADSSQIAVIEEVKKKRNLVVEGPPGTGKSQTIANMIAELLAAGKKVLFVSEKMAALEVVKERLDSVGLGDFCLELHSHKSNKREVLKELERSLAVGPPQKTEQNHIFDQIDSRKESLNAYVNALHEPINQTQKSPFTLFGVREMAQCHFENVERDMPLITFANPTETTPDCWTKTKQSLEELATILPLVTPVANNPWRGCKPDIVTPAYIKNTKALIGTCINALDALEKVIHDLADVCAIQIPTMLATLPQALKGVSVMSKAIPVEREVLLNDAWNRPNRESDTLIKKIEDVQKGIIEARAKFNKEQLIVTLEALRALEDKVHDIKEICGIQSISTPKDLRRVLNAANVMVNSIPVEREVLLNEDWNHANPEVEKLIKQVENVQNILTKARITFESVVLERDDIDLLQDEYKELCGIFPPVRFFHSKYNSIKKQIRSLYKDKPPRKIEAILTSLDELAHCINKRKEIKALEQTGRSLFGSHWKAEESDTDQLRQFAKWIMLFRKEFLDGTLTNRAVDLVSEGIASEHLKDLIRQAITQRESFVKERGTLLSQLEIDSKTVFGLDAEDVFFGKLSSQLEMWKAELPLFDSWIQFVHGNVGELSEKPEQLITDLAKLSQCTDIRTEIQDMEQTGQDLFGRYWRGEDSDPKRLRESKEWIVEFRKQLIGDVLTEQAIDIVGTGVNQEQIEHLAKQVETAKIRFVQKRAALFNHLGTDANALFGVETKKVSFTELRSRLELWEQGLTRLQAWEQFVRLRDTCQQTIAQPLISRIENDLLEPEDIVPCFEGNLADAFLDKAFRGRSELRDFVFNLHEEKIVGFRKLDSEIIELNRLRLITQLHQNRPRLFSGASSDSEIGILQKQFSRERGHMSIRDLLTQAGGLIQKIKPCFMMSPLSIAQFCDPQMVQFDVVVFDEASQIRLEDALGALLRGKQAIVIGDTRQLPPTRFFDGIVEDDEEKDEDDFTNPIVGVVSILDLCRQSVPMKELKWHYRSRHESLIAVSNQEFYDNNLYVFPSAIDKAEHLGLKFEHIPDAVYDRGKSSTNRQEAQAVVKAAFAHYRNYPNKSLGIGTFGIKQQQAILDEFEVQFQQQPEMVEFFASNREEYFFVKNLETIQGDERDVIFISVGYGFGKDGKLHKNFGPLSSDGGERRLNVLITRAREKCVVFSNFRASDLQLDIDAPFGVRALKTFLDYAETGNLPVPESNNPLVDPESPFEESVYEFLKSQGCKVSKQVGCAGYRIDLAVVDSTALGRYLIGIECDGAPYHSSPIARDRDRLRQQQLERLGWKLHRIWSTDWYRNRAETRRRLLEAVERAKAEKLSPVPIPEPIDPPKPSEPARSSESNFNPSNSLSIADHVQDYQTCKDLKIPMQGELHLQTTFQLAKAVREVVKIESPVHTDLVARRIRQLWGLKRAGERIKNAIEAGIAAAQRDKLIHQNGDFLWAADNREIKVRCRTKPKIEWICEEEIVEAMKFVLTSQGAMPDKSLITETAKLFGYKSARKTVMEKMKPLLDKLVKAGEFQILPNSRVQLS
ncbi:MAG: DUF3320 domain-containing protein [Candidatus Poribacteria bacterium]|nr:DUF3320 domain-containing protein [Candidatus Poribacteria bacterium]